MTGTAGLEEAPTSIEACQLMSKQAFIDQEVRSDTARVPERDDGGPLQVCDERIGSFGLPHEPDASRRTNRQQAAADAGSERHQQPLPLR